MVSWSEAVPLEVIQEIQDVTGASVSEILLSATSACLRDLLIQYSLDMPDSILVTARYCPQVKVFKFILTPMYDRRLVSLVLLELFNR